MRIASFAISTYDRYFKAHLASYNFRNFPAVNILAGLADRVPFSIRNPILADNQSHYVAY